MTSNRNLKMRNPKWKVITIGYLNRDHDGAEGVNGCLQSCTSTLIETGNRRILVDPGFDGCDLYQKILEQRSGCCPTDIDTIFLTHFHKNHRHCLMLFPSAVWLMSRLEIRWWQKNPRTTEAEQNFLSRIIPIEEHRLPGIEILPTPGHTHGCTSLMFETREGIIVTAGDAVLTFEHFDDREPSEYSEDPKTAKRSIDRIAKMADLVIPGHDNFFVV